MKDFLSLQEIFETGTAHLLSQGNAALLPSGGGAYKGHCGGCPVGNFIRPRDYRTSMEGIPVRYIGVDPNTVPHYMDSGVAALRRALLRSKINVYNDETVALLSCLQNVHDVFGKWEWRDRLASIAKQFGLNGEMLSLAA